MNRTAHVALKRRDFLKAAGAASLATAGYACAVQPIAVTAIHTPAAGLATMDTHVERGGARIPLYIARPERGGPFPAVIVIHEIFGQHEYIRDVTRRLAHAGFLAAAPELFFREGGVQHLQDYDAIIDVVESVPDRQMLDDLGAVLQTLRGLPQSIGKVGATGFCWGGGATWLFAADNSHLGAAVAWYGHLTDWGEGRLHPHNPIDLAGAMKCPVLGLYGAEDDGIPPSDVAAMRQALAKNARPGELVLYPGAGHGFHADYRPGYNAAAAQDGWRRCVAWFRRYLT